MLQEKAVFQSLSKFIKEAHFEEEIQDLPVDLQDLLLVFLESEIANDPKVRIKFVKAILTARELAKSLAPFSKDQVQQACNEMQA